MSNQRYACLCINLSAMQVRFNNIEAFLQILYYNRRQQTPKRQPMPSSWQCIEASIYFQWAASSFVVVYVVMSQLFVCVQLMCRNSVFPALSQIVSRQFARTELIRLLYFNIVRIGRGRQNVSTLASTPVFLEK
ncbi:Hypothetical_protein [Hexamita inflata]|uniref:Hypothetical_protein n=1 Tax=Hexamita inflata TaxID=28002 RepID=A0AA86U5K4_9EUKA|nr:Hypothetical protein HINF_LOCUS29429 [Hexamita inflata]